MAKKTIPGMFMSLSKKHLQIQLQWYKPRQVAACRPKCTVSRQTAHLAALMLRPTVKRWGMLWCILSFTRRPNSAEQKKKKKEEKQVQSFKPLKQKYSIIIYGPITLSVSKSVFKLHELIWLMMELFLRKGSINVQVYEYNQIMPVNDHGMH